MFELSGFQRDLLYVIASLEAPNGSEIQAKLDADYPDDVHHGRVYPNLDSLAERQFIQKGERDARTNQYQLTDQGVEALRSRQQWEAKMLDDGEFATGETPAAE